MKKILILIFVMVSSLLISQVPCADNNTLFLDLTPTGVGNTQSSSYTYAGEYNTFTACLGVQYGISVCGNYPGDNYDVGVTMYSGTGTLLYSQNSTGSGSCETFTWTSTLTGIVKILVDRANCGSNTKYTFVSVTQITSCGTSTTTSNQNCSTGTPVCNDVSFNGNSSGFGTQELTPSNQGCMTTEHQSSWYTFTVSTTGTISLNITTAVDYDFAIWGPNTPCSSLGTPIRCSWAAGGGNTGLGNGAVDITEGAGGDRWVAPMSVTAGQTYIMLIDNFTANSTPFTLDWTMSGGASLSCISVLPIELVDFSATKDNKSVILSWTTASESNNDYYTVEKSIDAINFYPLLQVPSKGNSETLTHYVYTDDSPYKGVNYYRLKQTDKDMSFTYSKMISIDNQFGLESSRGYNISPNPSYSGIFNIKADVKLDYEIYNSMGKLINFGSIDREDEIYLGVGIYFIKIKINGKIYTEKVISKD